MNMILSSSIHISHTSSTALKSNLSQLQPDSITQLSGLLVLDFSSKNGLKDCKIVQCTTLMASGRELDSFLTGPALQVARSSHF